MRFHGQAGNKITMPLLLTAILSTVALAQSVTDRATSEEVRALYDAGAWAQAAKLAANAQPRSADLELYLGLAHVHLSEFESARNAFITGYQNFPRDARFAEELAGVAYRDKNMPEAKRWLKRALNRNPSSEYANDFLGLLFLADDNLPAVLKYWNRIGKPFVHAVRLDPAPALNSLLLDRAVAASAGQVLLVDRLQTTQSNLDRIGILTDYRFELAPRQDQQFDLTLRTAGSIGPPGGNLGGWVGKLLPCLRGLPFETVYFDLSNIGQKATSLSALARWDSNKRRLAINFAGPVRLNPRWFYRIGVDARDETWDLTSTYFARPGALNEMKLRKIEAGGEFEYALTGRLAWTSGLWMARRDFRNHGQERFFANSWSAQFRNGLKYLLWTWPEQRVQADASVHLDTGHVFTGAPGREVIARGALSATWLPRARGDDLALNLHLSAGRIFGAAPFDDYFMLGMERDNDRDLWLRGHVGTRDGRKGSAPMGTRYLLLQTEINQTVFRLPFVRVQLAPFLDVGSIADSTRDFGSQGYVTDSGLQARIKTPGNLTFSFVYGRDLRHGRGVFYTTITKSPGSQ